MNWTEELKKFDKHDWNHLHDCILHVTWNTTQKKSTQGELEEMFLSLPESLKIEAYEWGMSDTLWRDKFIEYYEELLKDKKETIRKKIINNFQSRYCVKIGHPVDENAIASTNLIYYIVAAKDNKNNRGDIPGLGDTEWVTNFLKEIGEEYSTELFIMVIKISNEFIASLTDNMKLGINFK